MAKRQKTGKETKEEYDNSTILFFFNFTFSIFHSSNEH